MKDGDGDVGAVARLFLRLGTTAFGGPAAHIALMEDEVVRRRGWLSRGDFLDLLGAANLIPGPNSTELAIHIGLRRAGWRGLVAAGVCFILPAFAIVVALAWAYVRFGALPAVGALLAGAEPVVVVLIGQALWRLGRTALRSPSLAVLAVAAALAAAAGAPQAAVLLGSGAAAMAAAAARARGDAGDGGAAAGVLAAGGGAWGLGVVAYSLPALFAFFVVTGAVLFGSGYVLVALLQDTLVDGWGWLSQQQLLDAVAVGHVTPGPVFTTATFIGYVLGGFEGAVVATVGIFLPAFVFVWLTAPWVERMRGSPRAAAFLDGVNAAAVGLIAVVALDLGRAALAGPAPVAIALAAAALVAHGRVNPAWLVLGGAAAGLLVGR